MKIVVSKQTSQDESLQMEVTGKDSADLARKLAQGLEILDARLVQQGQRVIDATAWAQQFPPEVRMAINATMGVLFGRPGAIQEVQVAADNFKGKTAPAEEAVTA